MSDNPLDVLAQQYKTVCDERDAAIERADVAEARVAELEPVLTDAWYLELEAENRALHEKAARLDALIEAVERAFDGHIDADSDILLAALAAAKSPDNVK